MFEIDVQVQEVQQQLQNMELAMDSRESRVRKLEYEIKLMSGTLLHLGICTTPTCILIRLAFKVDRYTSNPKEQWTCPYYVASLEYALFLYISNALQP